MKMKMLLFLLLFQAGISADGRRAAFYSGFYYIADTTVLAESRTEVRIEREHPSAVLPFQIDLQKLDKSSNLSIQFDGIFMEKPPEGIYEVYLTDSMPVIMTLAASSPFFVHAINTYYLAGDGPGRQLMNAGRQLRGIQKNKNRVHYLAIVFRGNSFADHSVSGDAGILKIKTIRLVSL